MNRLWTVSATFLSVAWLLLATGCATRRPAPDDEYQLGGKADLAARLIELSNTVNHAEARLLADTAYNYSLDLAERYRAVRPAALQNILVNTGFRERGLCFQWADDLTAKLDSLELQTLQLHRAVARLGTPREHSAVVVTAVGQPFDDGVVLDAWRRQGLLCWNDVIYDTYKWIRVEIVTNAEPVIKGSRQTR
ncbi:MAG TPA: hypothetical protein PKA41_07730 [Verrucomicrobiota bacterium]|nr:hypothetical protein [Verrucomicrobiota bacterium]